MCTEKITIFWPFLCGRQIICECFCEILYAIKKATTRPKKNLYECGPKKADVIVSEFVHSTLDDFCGFELLRSGTTSIHVEFSEPHE